MTTGFHSDDAEMAAAIDEAKRSFRRFLETFLNPGEGQQSFLVKVAFEDDERVEHIWIADLEFHENGLGGVVANDPELSNLHFMQHVQFDPGRITDWMFIDNGRLVGGYTTRLIRHRMSPDEQAAFDASVPYSF